MRWEPIHGIVTHCAASITGHRALIRAFRKYGPKFRWLTLASLQNCTTRPPKAHNVGTLSIRDCFSVVMSKEALVPKMARGSDAAKMRQRASRFGNALAL